MRTRKDIVEWLLANPDRMLLKKPFLRGGESWAGTDPSNGESEYVNARRTATLPRVRKNIVTQDQFMRELDPETHEVMFDRNMPSICVRLEGGGYKEINFRRTAVDIQERIRQKQTLSLGGNPRVLTLHDSNPDETMQKNFADIKWHWTDSNQDGLGTKAVYTQKGLGDAGLLMYFTENMECRGRILSYEDGYVIISHNDDNGDRVMECVYYSDEDGTECMDCYDDTYLYRMTNEGGWSIKETTGHGFSEIPLITKRGDVAWNKVQGLIDVYEILLNIFAVIQKRHGWGILYIKGKFKEEARKLAGSVILQDTSIDGNGSAEFKSPPSPEGMIDTLDKILDQIQIGSSVTFILPKDISTSGDISGIAMQITRSLDIEGAAKDVIDWQNFASKHIRLYKEGLAKQLVNSGENPNAVTEFARMNVGCKFKMWQPFDENTYNQMLCTMKGAGIISQKTSVEKNTISAPDEQIRIEREAEEQAKREQVPQTQAVTTAS